MVLVRPSMHKGPLFIGVAGGTGSGKTTVADAFLKSMPEGAAVIVDHDSYYKDHSDLSEEERALVNYDHPDALDNDLLVEHLRALRERQTVNIPRYDFVEHRRGDHTRRVEAAPVVIVEGILVFVDKRIRDLLDVKIFVDTDADIRLMRRVRRDIEERGREFSQIREQYYKTVRPMHLKFVEPSKQFADLIVPEGGANKVALDLVFAKWLRVVAREYAFTEPQSS